MAAFLEGIDNDQSQRAQIMDILDEAICIHIAREMAGEIGADVMIAHRRQHRPRHIGKQLGDDGIAFLVALVGEIAGSEQDVGDIGAGLKPRYDLIDPLTIELVGVSGIEPDVNIRDLCDQHRGFFRPAFIMSLHRVAVSPRL